MKRFTLSILAAGAALAALAAPASASVTVITDPAATAASCGGITFTGITELACAGGFSGNLVSGSLGAPGLAALNSLGGYTGTATYLEKINIASGSHTINLSTLLTGITYIAIHYGNGSGFGNATSVFKFDAGAGVDSFTFGPNGLSNVALMQIGSAPTAAVPEPATWAMMIAGIGLVGASMRRRKAAVSFA